jgi:hypothetical protein
MIVKTYFPATAKSNKWEVVCAGCAGETHAFLRCIMRDEWPCNLEHTNDTH